MSSGESWTGHEFLPNPHPTLTQASAKPQALPPPPPGPLRNDQPLIKQRFSGGTGFTAVLSDNHPRVKRRCLYL